MPGSQALQPAAAAPSRCRRPRLAPPRAAAAAAAADSGSNSQQQQQNKKKAGALSAWREWWRLDDPSAAAAEAAGVPTAPQTMGDILRKVGGLLAPDKLLMCCAVFFMVGAAAAELAIPHFVTAAVFAAAKERSEQAFRHHLVCLACATATYAVFAAIRGWMFSLVNTNLLQRLRSQLFWRLICQPVAFFDATETAQLTSRLAADCSMISRLFATSINVALRNTLQVVGGGIYLWRLSPAMTATTAGVAAVLVAVASCYGAFTRRTQRIYQDALAGSNAVAEEGFSLSRLVRSFGSEAGTRARYDGTLGMLRRISIRQGVAYAMYVCGNNFLYNACRVATLAVGGTAAIAGTVGAEQLTAFMFYTEFLASALLSVCDQWGPIMEAVGASERVMSYLDCPPAPQMAAGRIPGVDTPAAEGEEAGKAAAAAGGGGGDANSGGLRWQVELAGVEFSYPSRPDAKALDHVSLSIPAGKLTALVGLSGSGKSTLVALIQRLYDPSAGAVLLDGEDLREVDAAWFRRRVGVVSQDPRLFGMTVAENIGYGCPDATQADVERAAQLANAHDFISALPQGYSTPVTDKLLSGGQRQRIAIARALVRDPQLLILDEATSALDAESEAAVQSALDRAMRTDGRTVIVIAHRLSTVRNADQTVVMDKGTVAEVGTHSELMRRGGIYAALVRRQAGAVLDQERDLAPHERQVSSGSSGEHAGMDGEGGGSGAGGEMGSMGGGGGGSGDGPGEEPQLPDSLPQWKQQQRLRVEHDPA